MIKLTDRKIKKLIKKLDRSCKFNPHDNQFACQSCNKKHNKCPQLLAREIEHWFLSRQKNNIND